MALVGLEPAWRERYPHAFSGGQRQRIGIARAIALKPRLVIADEATSALDVSLRAQMLDLMMRLQDELGLAFLFISHDMSVIRYMCDRVAVMYRGRIVETGPTEQVTRHPEHDYTKALLSAIPNPDPRERRIHTRHRYREPRMKITDIRVIVCAPGRNFVTVKIFTDEGLTGVGDATLNGREKAVVAYLEEHVVPCLIGRDAARIEDIWQYLYRGAYWRRGPVTMAAIAGIDTALWDIKAKAAGMPLYQLLGGASRSEVLCYTHAQGRTIEEAVEAVGARLDQGYRAVRAQVAVPGLGDSYGTGAKSVTNNAADDALPHEELWSTPKYLVHVPKLFAALRDTYGFDPHLLHDSHHRLTPIEAARLGKDLEPYRLFWLEDAVAAEHQEGFRLIREPHDDAPRRRRGLQHHLGRAPAHRGAAHRLHPHHHRARRRPDRAPPDHGLRLASTTSAPPATARWTCRRSASAPTSTSTSGCRTSASRNIPAISTRPSKSSPAPGPSRTAPSTPATPPATASTSTRPSPRNTPTAAPTCR